MYRMVKVNVKQCIPICYNVHTYLQRHKYTFAEAPIYHQNGSSVF